MKEDIYNLVNVIGFFMFGIFLLWQVHKHKKKSMLTDRQSTGDKPEKS